MTSPPRGYPESGEMLGPYRIVRRLGFGGMGVVFEAVDEVLRRSVALKVISPHLADDEGFRTRFIHEAQAQASVRSPHVVAVFAHGEADGRLYIATELVDAGDLGRLVAEHGAPPLPTALDILAQVSSGLADAHAAGLVHRDIKPANVLLRRRDDGIQAYLADFGIARQVGTDHGLTQVGGTVGTPSYMAPELHTGGRAGIESDIYSLGCLLWAALSGVAPYVGSSDYQVVTAHLEQPVPQLRAGTPAADLVNQVLLRSLAKRPTERYVGAAAMSRDLQEAARLAERTGEAVVIPVSARREVPQPTQVAAGRQVFAARHTATPTPAPPRVTSPSPAPVSYVGGRRRAALVVAAVLVVLLAGVGVALAVTGDGSSEGAGGAGAAPTAASTAGDPTPTSTPTSTASGTASGTGSSSATANPSAAASPSAGERDRAVDSLSTALAEQPGVTRKSARCVARRWVGGVGLRPMAAAGFFDARWRYVDQPQEAITDDMRRVLTGALAECAVGPAG